MCHCHYFHLLYITADSLLVAAIIAPGSGSPAAMNIVVVHHLLLVVLGVLVVIRFSKYYNFFISQPIVIKLWLLIADKIPDFRIMSDF